MCRWAKCALVYLLANPKFDNDRHFDKINLSSQNSVTVGTSGLSWDLTVWILLFHRLSSESDISPRQNLLDFVSFSSLGYNSSVSTPPVPNLADRKKEAGSEPTLLFMFGTPRRLWGLAEAWLSSSTPWPGLFWRGVIRRMLSHIRLPPCSDGKHQNLN